MQDFFQNLFGKPDKVQPNAKGVGGMIGGIVGGVVGGIVGSVVPGAGTTLLGAAGNLGGKLVGDALDNNLPPSLWLEPKAEQDRFMNAIRERNKTPEERQAEAAQAEAARINADTERINQQANTLEYGAVNIGQKQSKFEKMPSGINDRGAASRIDKAQMGGKNAAVVQNKSQYSAAQNRETLATQLPQNTPTTVTPLVTDTQTGKDMPKKTAPFSFTNKWHNLPIWSWCLIGVATLGALGTVGYFAFKK